MSDMEKPSKEQTRQTLQKQEARLGRIAERFDQLDEMLEQVEAHIETNEFARTNGPDSGQLECVQGSKESRRSRPKKPR